MSFALRDLQVYATAAVSQGSSDIERRLAVSILLNEILRLRGVVEVLTLRPGEESEEESRP